MKIAKASHILFENQIDYLELSAEPFQGQAVAICRLVCVMNTAVKHFRLLGTPIAAWYLSENKHRYH